MQISELPVFFWCLLSLFHLHSGFRQVLPCWHQAGHRGSGHQPLIKGTLTSFSHTRLPPLFPSPTFAARGGRPQSRSASDKLCVLTSANAWLTKTLLHRFPGAELSPWGTRRSSGWRALPAFGMAVTWCQLPPSVTSSAV